MKLKRITTPSAPGREGSTSYETQDGRFTVVKLYNRTGNVWQAQARDGTEPFRGMADRRSRYYNSDTLGDVRDELGLIYE